MYSESSLNDIMLIVFDFNILFFTELFHLQLRSDIKTKNCFDETNGNFVGL